jgi:probable HAF family extracellular repeat protein
MMKQKTIVSLRGQSNSLPTIFEEMIIMNKRMTILYLLIALLFLAIAGLLTLPGTAQEVGQDPAVEAPVANVEGSTLRVVSPLTDTVTYTVTDLGTWRANGLNDAGQVVGVSFSSRAILWLPEPAYGLPAGMNDLGTLGGSASRAMSINETGQIAGWADTNGGRRAFLWLPEPAYDLPAGMNDLGHLGGGTSQAYDVNNAGQVVGMSQSSGGNRAFLWEQGSMTNLGTLGGTFSLAYGVNGSGQVVGESRIENDDDYHPFLWEGGAMIALATLGGGPDSAAHDINDAGDIVGESEKPPTRPILWSDGGMTELDTLANSQGRVKAINNAGQMIGASVDNNNQQQPVIWDIGAITNLNELIDLDSGWVLQSAEDINDAGQIVGYGTLDGEQRAFLLTPEEKAWTLMFYLAGDNDLAHTYPPILNQLERAADNPNVNVIVLWDGSEIGDSAYIEIQHDDDLNNLADYTEGENYWDQGELDTSDPATLTNFVSWAMSNYPARHYALFLTDHGTGLGGGLFDDTSGYYMFLDDIQQALLDTPTLVGQPLDILYMDMCLMGMVEVAYEMRDYADYMVASQHVQWASSQPYFNYVDGIAADTTPATLAVHFASAYTVAVAPDGLAYTISAVDMSRLDDVVAATDALAQALQTNMETIAFALADVAEQVQRYDMNDDHVIDTDDSYADLTHLAQLVEQEMADYPEIVAEAQALQAAIASYVIAEAHDSSDNVDLENSHGVAIFFPTNASSFYDGFNNDFASGTDWGSLVPGASLAEGALLPNAAGQEEIAWGPMLVSYIEQVNPDGPDDPEPPEPVARLLRQSSLFLPIVIR